MRLRSVPFLVVVVLSCAAPRGGGVRGGPAGGTTEAEAAAAARAAFLADSLGRVVVDGFVPRRYNPNAADVPYRLFAADMPYRLFIPPGYDATKEYPLVVWLHGAGGIGTDNVRQITGDQVPGTRLWTTPANQAAHPTFVLVPQAQTGWYSGTGAPVGGGTPLRQVFDLITQLESEYRIDRRRIYITGQSNGGGGAWGLIAFRPNRFAAAVILCPAGLLLEHPPTSIPVWVFSGKEDMAGFQETAAAIVGAVRKAGAEARLTEYPKVGHEVWLHAFKEPELVEWVFAQHR